MRARWILPCVLLAALPAAGLGQGLSIDLADPDPVRLAELPGITLEEIELLQEMGGLEARELGERGATRSIPRDRWLAWLPYLERRDAAGGSIRGRVRGRTERSATGVLRDRLELSARGPGGGMDLRRRGTFDPRARSQTVGAEGRVWLRPSRAIDVSLGSIAPALSGPDPWDDPLRASTSTTPVLPAPGVGMRSGARGGALRIGPVQAAGATIAGRASMLFSASGRALDVFWGRSEDRGEGWGGRARWKALSIAAALHHPYASRPILRWVALRGSTAVASAWSFGEAPGTHTARVDATHGVRRAGSTSRLSGSVRIGGSSRPIDAALRARAAAHGPAERSGELLASSRRLRCDLVWGSGRETLQVGARARLERVRGAGWGALVLEGSTGSAGRRLELALLARTDGRVGWPLPDASDLRALLGLRGRAAIGLPRGSLAARVLVPLAGGGPTHRTTALRLEIERESGP